MARTYSIVRIREDYGSSVVDKGLSYEEATESAPYLSGLIAVIGDDTNLVVESFVFYNGKMVDPNIVRKIVYGLSRFV